MRPALTLHTNEAKVQAQRKRELGWIHQGKAALGWSDDDYRYHLHQKTGKHSAAELDAKGRRLVLDHMAACGFKPKSAGFKHFGQADKIKWLWRKLGETGALHNTSNQALVAFIGRVTGMGVSDPKFLPVAQASTVIEALKDWLDRAKKAR